MKPYIIQCIPDLTIKISRAVHMEGVSSLHIHHGAVLLHWS